MNEQENNTTNTTTEPVVNTSVETPVIETTTTSEVAQPPVAETPITQEKPTVTIGTPEVNIPEETSKKQSNGSKIFIVIIILVLALIAGFLVFRYVKGELDDNNLANEPEEELPVEVDTPETDHNWTYAEMIAILAGLIAIITRFKKTHEAEDE